MMAKKAVKKPASSTKRKTPAKPRQAKSGKSGSANREKGNQRRQSSESMSAADAIAGILESPLVAEIIAAGAAAALAALTQQAISRRGEGGAKRALKEAAKAAGVAMGTRITAEFGEIMESAKRARAEEA